tara:strand:- start:8849 stop:9388 length:540 start_codon:yes stop_codon:yes gene_type:complete
MKIKIFTLVLLIPLFIISEDDSKVAKILCDEEIKLVIDEENMTNEEIVMAKDEYFHKLLAQANLECISQLTQTTNLNVKQTNAGGSISGSDIKKSQIKSSSSTLGTPKINEINKKNIVANNNVLANGAVPACISKIKDTNQVSIQLKEAIGKEKDEQIKQELIRNYAIYNNIKPETLKC